MWVDAVGDLGLGKKGESNVGAIQHPAGCGKATVAAIADVVGAKAYIRALICGFRLLLFC